MKRADPNDLHAFKVAPKNPNLMTFYQNIRRWWHKRNIQIQVSSALPAQEAVKIEALICGICGKEPSVGDYRWAEMPISVEIGKKCQAKRAEPFRWLRHRACSAAVNGVRNQASYDNWLDKSKTYVDGRYVSLRKALARYPITQEELRQEANLQKPLDDQQGWGFSVLPRSESSLAMHRLPFRRHPVTVAIRRLHVLTAGHVMSASSRPKLDRIIPHKMDWRICP